MKADSAELQGVVISGLGEGAMFSRLDWVVAQVREKLGFDPHPGTFNLRLEGGDWSAVRARLDAAAGIAIVPLDGFCAAKCFPVVLGSVGGAVVFPEIPSYPADKFEILAPVSLRRALGVRDGDRVTVRVFVG